MYIKSFIAAALIFAAGADPLPTSAPATTAPADRQWGPAKAGLSVSILTAGEWTLTGTMKVNLAVRNTGVVPVSLGGKDRLFVYLLIRQGSAAFYNDTIFYTEKILPAKDFPNWPKQLGPGKVLHLPAFDVSGLDALSYMRGLRVVGGYPAHVVGGKVQTRIPDGSLAKVLLPGRTRVQCACYLDRGREGALLLQSGVINVTLCIGDFARLPITRRKQLLADMASRMKEGVFIAKFACADAVRIGPSAVPTLIGIVHDGQVKYFARMWAATALAQIGGKDAVEVLIECLTDQTTGVRHVAAYQGLRAKSDKFDKALTKRAVSGEDAPLTAWAIMGYLKFRKSVPPALLAAGLESPNWKARAAVAETMLHGNPDRSHLPILRQLLRDPNAMVRRTAARAVGSVKGGNSRETIEALIKALALEGDDARSFVAAALGTLTGKKWPYHTDATAEEKQQVLRKWRQWWERSKATYRASETKN